MDFVDRCQTPFRKLAVVGRDNHNRSLNIVVYARNDTQALHDTST